MTSRNRRTSSSKSSSSSRQLTSKNLTSSDKAKLSSMTKQLQQAQSQLNSYKSSQTPAKTTTTTTAPKATSTPSKTSSSGGSSGGSSGALKVTGTYNPLGANAVSTPSTLTKPTLPASQTKTGLTVNGKAYSMPQTSSNTLTLPSSGALPKGLTPVTTPKPTGLTNVRTGQPMPVPNIDNTPVKIDQTLPGLAWSNKNRGSGGSSGGSGGGSGSGSGGGSGGGSSYQPTPQDNSALRQDLLSQLDKLQGELGTMKEAQRLGFTGDSSGAAAFLSRYDRGERPAADSRYPNQERYTDPNRADNQGFLQDLADRTNASVAFTQLNSHIEQIKENIRKSKENYAKQRQALYAEPGTITFKQGKDRLIQEQYKMEQSAMAEEANAIADQIAGLNTQQANQIQAASAGAGYTQPVAVPYGQAYGSPQDIARQRASSGLAISSNDPFYSTMQQYAQMLVNNQEAQIPGEITSNPVLYAQIRQMAGTSGGYNSNVSGANAASVADIRGKINTIDSVATALVANATTLQNYARRVNGSTPIEQGLAQLSGGTIQNSREVAAYRSKLSEVRTAYEAMGLGDGQMAFPDNMTAAQLGAKLSSLTRTIQTNKQNLQETLDNLLSSGSSSGGGYTNYSSGSGEANPWH